MGNKRQAAGAMLLALLLCGQVAAGAAAAGRIRAATTLSSPSVSASSAVSRAQLDLHITLLKKLQGLTGTTQGQAKAGKGPRTSQAPPSLPGNLAASLEQWRDGFNWNAPPTGPAGAGWQSVASASQAAAVQAQAHSVASYYMQPNTVALLKANPSAVPSQLRGPTGMTREQACQEANKMDLPAQIKRQVCDATYPWPCAEAAAGLNMDHFLGPQAPIIAGQMNNWFKAVANGWGSPGRGRAPHYNSSTPVRPGPRRSLQGTCSTTDGLLQLLLGDGRDYFCLGVDCEMQIPGLPLYFYLGVQGCAGALRLLSDGIVACFKDGCQSLDMSDPKIVGQVITSIVPQVRIDVHAGLCLGIEGLGKVLKKLGLGVCIGPTLAIYPWAWQIVGSFGASLWVAGLEFAAKIQLANGRSNPFCMAVETGNKNTYNKIMKCVDWCSWPAGRGDVEFGAWLNLFFFRKTWSYVLLSDPVPACDP